MVRSDHGLGRPRAARPACRGGRSARRAAPGLAPVLLVIACSPGPGRRPAFEDAAVPRDAERARDAAAPRDAGAFEVGDVAIGVVDLGAPPRFPFTGIFGARGSGDPLLARELDGRAVVVVGAAPYVYVGAIGPEGEVDLASPVLERAGCPRATLSGTYGRASATFELEHVTCNARGELVQSTLRGGFARDFEPAVSGVYEGQASQILDPSGCAAGLPPSRPLRWGLGVLPDGRALLMTLEGPIEEPFVYFGRLSGGGLALLAPAVAGRQEVAFQGEVRPGAAGEPAGLAGRRDAFRPLGRAGCTFTQVVELSRTEAP